MSDRPMFPIPVDAAKHVADREKGDRTARSHESEAMEAALMAGRQ